MQKILNVFQQDGIDESCQKCLVLARSFQYWLEASSTFQKRLVDMDMTSLQTDEFTGILIIGQLNDNNCNGGYFYQLLVNVVQIYDIDIKLNIKETRRNKFSIDEETLSGYLEKFCYRFFLMLLLVFNYTHLGIKFIYNRIILQVFLF